MTRVCLVMFVLLFACQPPGSNADGGPTGTTPAGQTPSASCPDGYTTCGGSCFDTEFDPRHCGSCAGVCDSGGLCLDGTCRAGAAACDRAHGCPSAYYCDLNTSRCVYGCVADWQCKDPYVCDRSAHACVDPNGTPAQPPPTVIPGAGCTSPGECGAGTTCDLETRRCVCAAGTSVCSGACKSLGDDHDNCGLCGLACAANQVCKVGLCVNTSSCDDFSCALGQHCNYASGACAAGCTLPQHCAVGQSCVGGACLTCTPDCRGKACGDDGCGSSCGSCAAGQTCSAQATCVTLGSAVPELDLLLIVDDSGSMQNIQDEVKAAAPLLIDALDATVVDYRIGVTTTDLTGGHRAPGFFLQSGAVITRSMADRKAQLGAVLSTLDTNGSPTEFGALTALVDALPSGTTLAVSNPDVKNPLKGARYAKFWRDSARYGVIVFSDEDDSSGTLTTFTVQDIASQLLQQKTSSSLIRFAAVVEMSPTTTSCTRSMAAGGAPAYTAFHQALGAGVSMQFSICSAMSAHVPALTAFLTQ